MSVAVVGCVGLKRFCQDSVMRTQSDSSNGSKEIACTPGSFRDQILDFLGSRKRERGIYLGGSHPECLGPYS